MTALTPLWRNALEDHVEVLAWSPDSRELLAGSLAGDAVVLDATTGATNVKLAGHTFGVLSGAWRPDGALLATGGHDGQVRISDGTGSEIAAVALDGWVSRCAWSPGRRPPCRRCRAPAPPPRQRRRAPLVRRARLHRHRSGLDAQRSPRRRHLLRRYRLGRADGRAQPSARLRLEGIPALPRRLPHRPVGGRRLAGRHRAHLAALVGRRPLDVRLPGQGRTPRLRRRRPLDGQRRDITIWPFAGKGPKGTRPARAEERDRHVTTLEWDPRRTRLASGSADGTLILWPAPRRKGQTVRPLEVLEADTGVARAAWSPDGSRLAVAHADGAVQVLVVS